VCRRHKLASIIMAGRNKASCNFKPTELDGFYPLTLQVDKLLYTIAPRLRQIFTLNFCFLEANNWHTLCLKLTKVRSDA
jgi:hypothetical protein